jgi:hypothetical protein
MTARVGAPELRQPVRLIDPDGCIEAQTLSPDAHVALYYELVLSGHRRVWSSWCSGSATRVGSCGCARAASRRTTCLPVAAVPSSGPRPAHEDAARSCS